MFDVAVSQLTTPRWDLARELAAVADHGFTAISLWRPKLSDLGIAATAKALITAGIRVSSLQWVGGFTGGDGRTFAESVADASEAIVSAGSLAAASQPPVVVVHSGCRGGHTRSHAERLLVEALATLVPLARSEGVTLAIKPLHAAFADGCTFLTRLDATVGLVERFADPHVRMALDLWQFADGQELDELLPRVAAVTGLVHVADRARPVGPYSDRLPAGRGTLPLEACAIRLVECGYRGDFEFDPVGEVVQELGYDDTHAETRRVADQWLDRMQSALPARALRIEPPHLQQFQGIQRRGVGARRSQASTQVVSRG